MSDTHHELEGIERHIAEARWRIDDLNWRIASIEQSGGNSSDMGNLLRQFREALTQLIASREPLLREKGQQS